MNKKPHSKLWLYFAGIVFATIASVFLLLSLFWLMLSQLQLLSVEPRSRHIPILVLLAGSLLIGCTIALFVGKLIIRPIHSISSAFEEISRGNFDVRVRENEKIDEIREMAQSFNAMTYDLSHIETLRSDFVANVSHKFKTPIAAIEGYATLLQNPSLSRQKHDCYVEKILDNSRRLSNLSSNILALSKLENQQMVIDNKEFRLDEQIRKAILALESKWSPKNLVFNMDLQKQMYYGSEPLLGQVWSNILDNAIKYSPEGGVIRVSIQKTVTELIVTVGNQGEGMTEEVQKHIFEKFYQGDSSRKSEGSGLGLALVKRILHLCRGFVTVESAPGQGAVFSIHLPL